MSRNRATPLNPKFWVLLRSSPTSCAKLRIWSMTRGISSHEFVSSFHASTISKSMSHFLCKSFLCGSYSVRNLSPISENNPNVFPLRWISTSSNHQSFTVSYLVKSLGLSPQTALSVSKRVNFSTPDKPDKIINLLKKYGFNQYHISRLVSRGYPKILLVDAEKTIFPKLEFLKGKGISGPEMAKKLSLYPNLLKSSLTRKIMTSYDFYKNLCQSDERVVKAVKRCPDILVPDIEKYVAPKIDILREHGMPDSKIATWTLSWPMSFTMSSDRFRKIVKKVEDMGFKASNVNFAIAMVTFIAMDESKWKRKVDAYKKWGWLEEDILRAFHKHPWCMTLSEDKLMAGMDFFINKMGSTPCLIANNPKLLSLSLKKRLIPRSLVFQVLLSKGLVKEKVSLAVLFYSPEKKFLQKFVVPYEDKAPELLKLYKEKNEYFKKTAC